MPVVTNPIKFGTDGWRGVIGEEFTFDRLASVVPVAAQVLYDNYFPLVNNRKIIIGYDRRFMAEDFAAFVAQIVVDFGFDALLGETYAPTPAFSWAAKHFNALGALVITASHNPAAYLGLKVKSTFGGSVPPEVTQSIEAKLYQEVRANNPPGKQDTFDPGLVIVKG